MAKVTIQATFKQREFLWFVLNDDINEQIGFGGARGGGKTFVSCLAMVLRRIKYPNTRGLMLRQTQGAADQNLGEEIRKVLVMLNFPMGKERGGAYWLQQDKKWVLPNGSYIKLGYCKSDSDWETYQGQEYMDIAFEEATQMKERAFLDIVGSNRQTLYMGVTGKVWITCNPGGIGTEWVERRFINPKTRDRRTAWIKALLRENMAMLENDPGYRDRVLAKQPEWRRKQWEEGDWDAVEGQFFVVDPRIVRSDIEIPYYADLYAGVDAGYFPSSFACVWAFRWKDAKTGKTRVHIIRELKKQKLNSRVQAEEAVAIENQIRSHVCRGRFADPNSWKKTESSEGANSVTAHSWAQHGFLVTPALSNARAAGWLLLRTMFDNYNISIDESCVALWREISDAIHDDKTDDIDDKCEDHLLDALRYMLMSIFAGQPPSNPDDPWEKKNRQEHQKVAKRIVYLNVD